MNKEDAIKPHRWAKGESGNPAGRPKGSRNKFCETLISAFLKDFARHGAAAIRKVREERPSDYLRVAASLIPRQIELEAEVTMTHEERLAERERLIAEYEEKHRVAIN